MSARALSRWSSSECTRQNAFSSITDTVPERAEVDKNQDICAASKRRKYRERIQLGSLNRAMGTAERVTERKAKG